MKNLVCQMVILIVFVLKTNNIMSAATKNWYYLGKVKDDKSLRKILPDTYEYAKFISSSLVTLISSSAYYKHCVLA